MRNSFCSILFVAIAIIASGNAIDDDTLRKLISGLDNSPGSDLSLPEAPYLSVLVELNSCRRYNSYGPRRYHASSSGSSEENCCTRCSNEKKPVCAESKEGLFMFYNRCVFRMIQCMKKKNWRELPYQACEDILTSNSGSGSSNPTKPMPMPMPMPMPTEGHDKARSLREHLLALSQPVGIVGNSD